MRRSEQITDPEIALFEIRAGHKLFYHKCCMSASQLKTWSIQRLLTAVESGKLYIARERTITA